MNVSQPPIVPIEIRALSTQIAQKTCASKYDKFVVHQQEACKQAGLDATKYKLWDDLTEADVCGTVLPGGIPFSEEPPVSPVCAELANFFLNDTKNDGDKYAPFTTVGFFSSFKGLLFKRFKPLGYRTDSPEWYEQLHRGLKMRAIVECIKRGGTVSKKAVGMSKDAMKNPFSSF